MIGFLKRLLETNAPPAHTELDARIASCALLIALSEVDGSVEASETETILDLLRQQHDLTPTQARELLAEAQGVSDASIDLWQLTSRLNERCSKDERLYIVEMMWQVVYADGHFDDHEHHMMSRIPDLLRLERALVIEKKLKVRDGT